jgi:hypothetical protein
MNVSLTLHRRRSARAQGNTLFIGLDVHKESIAVAYVAEAREAEDVHPHMLSAYPNNPAALNAMSAQAK